MINLVYINISSGANPFKTYADTNKYSIVGIKIIVVIKKSWTIKLIQTNFLYDKMYNLKKENKMIKTLTQN